MDPNANLRAQRAIAERIAAQIDRDETPHPADIANLCELVTALDEWISRGGFLPSAWVRR